MTWQSLRDLFANLPIALWRAQPTFVVVFGFIALVIVMTVIYLAGNRPG